jgi:hypothetical protein
MSADDTLLIADRRRAHRVAALERELLVRLPAAGPPDALVVGIVAALDRNPTARVRDLVPALAPSERRLVHQLADVDASGRSGVARLPGSADAGYRACLRSSLAAGPRTIRPIRADS